MFSRRAISLLDRPSAICASTSRSRAVSASRPPTAVGLFRDRTSVPAASGARTVCPSCTERTARTSASGSTSLYRKPAAPPRIATVTDAESATLVSTSTLAGRFRSLSSASTPSPSRPGSFRSSRITSGATAAASSTASAPSPASPTTSMSGCRLSSTRSPCRTTGWSSAIRTVIFPAADALTAAPRARRGLPA